MLTLLQWYILDSILFGFVYFYVNVWWWENKKAHTTQFYDNYFYL